VYGKGVGVDAGAFDHPPAGWTAVVDEGEVPAVGGIAVRAGDTEVALFRDGRSIRAIAERCTHRGGPLHEGEMTEGRVECPWHGSVFDLRDGEIVRGPATAPQQSFEARVRAGKVEVRRRP
jgi:nitrite reductase/ring-hydroxylating ferredoxin subunit